MGITPQKRKEMEKLTSDMFKELDPTGTNSKHYQELFDSMSDTQLDKFLKDFFNDDDEYFILHMVDYERDLTIENVEKCAKVLKIPLFETLYYPHVTMNKNKIVATPYEVPVGFLNVKRTQQTGFKKNGMSTNVSKRSPLTNQVVDKDKNGRESDMESSILTAIGATNIMREFMGPRSDDSVMKNEFYSQINEKGYSSLEELTYDPANKTALNTANVFLLGMSINSDLITNTLYLKSTIREES